MRDLFPIDNGLSVAAMTLDEMFEEFWRQYPRRVAKGAARTAFKRVLAKKIATFDQLMSGVLRYSAERMGEDAQYTKHPSTWIRGECWADDPKPKPPVRLNSATIGLLSGLPPEETEAALRALGIDPSDLAR